MSDDNNFDSDSPTIIYERNSEGFEYSMDANGNIKLKRGHTFFTMYDFRNVL